MKIEEKPDVDLRLLLSVNEDEARALDALAGYRVDCFVDAFYKTLGKAYMEKHEEGLREFLQSIRAFVPGALARVDAAREAFER